MSSRDAQTEVLRDTVREGGAFDDPANIRDSDQVDGTVLAERGLGPPEIHEEDGASLVRSGAFIADDIRYSAVDERLVRRPVEQGEILTRGRVQIGCGPSVREDLAGPEGVRVD